MIIPAVNHVIYGYNSLSTTPGTTSGASHWRKNIVAVITQDRLIDDNLKRQIKNQTMFTCTLFLLTQLFQYISNWSKVFEHLPTLILQYT